MAFALALDDVPAEPLNPRGLILDGRPPTYAVPTVKHFYWRWNDEPTMEWQYLGRSKSGSALSVTFPFDVTVRQIRVGYVATTDEGVPNVADLRNMVQSVYPQAPTFTSATFNTGDLDTDLVFVKNSTGTGDIKVEYKLETDLTWLTHATDFAHNATSGSVTIPQDTTSKNWTIRLRQEGIDGYSRILTVTVNGSGGGNTAPTFSTVTYDSANSEVDLTFAKNGSGTGNIQVEYSVTGLNSWSTHPTEFAHGATSGSVVITEGVSAVTYDIRLKQSGVTGYSVTRSVTVDAAPSGPPTDLQINAENLVAACEWEIELAWNAGSGSNTYTVERKLGGGSWIVRDNNVSGTAYTDTVFGVSSNNQTFRWRVKHNDVVGYSNEVLTIIERCFD